MGRNFHSVCHSCDVQLMHLRGQEGNHMQHFANDHPEGGHDTEIYNDYISEPPMTYTDVYEEYNPTKPPKGKTDV